MSACRAGRSPRAAGWAACAVAALLSACATPITPGSIIVGNPQAVDRAAVDRLRARLVGTWKLIAIRDRDWITGAETPAERAADDGQLIYAANGRLSVQIVRVGRDQAAPGSADGFSSYFGRWQLVPAEGCIIHYQEGNLNVAQNRPGRQALLLVRCRRASIVGNSAAQGRRQVAAESGVRLGKNSVADLKDEPACSCFPS